MSYIFRNSNAQYRLGQVQTRYFSGRKGNNNLGSINKPGDTGGTGGTGGTGSASNAKDLFTNYSKQYESLQKSSEQLGQLDFNLPKAEDEAGKEALEKQINTITKEVQNLLDGLNGTNKLMSSSASLSADMKVLYEEFKGVAKGMSDKLAKVGISIGSDGSLSLDKDKLSAALKEDASSVKNLLTGTKGLGGQATNVAGKGVVIAAKISANALSGSNSGNDSNNWWQYSASSEKEVYQDNTIGSLFKSLI